MTSRSSPRSSRCRSSARSLLLFVDRDEERSERWSAQIALVVSLLVFAVTLLLWAASTRRPPTSSSSSGTRGFRRSASSYYVGVDGISLLLVVLTGFLTPLALLGVVGVGAQADAKAFCDLHAAARERDDRRVRLARPVPVLRVLGRDADPDVLPDRHLGLRPAHLRRGQVHPLHDGRQRADAARDPRPRRTCTTRRPAPTASTC